MLSLKVYTFVDNKIDTKTIMVEGFDSFFTTVRPVCNDHLYNKIYYLWVIH